MKIQDQFFENIKQVPAGDSFLDCEFITCEFLEGSLVGKSFLDCCFFGCDLGSLDMSEATFVNCRFRDCRLENVDFVATKELLDVQFDTCFLNPSISTLEGPRVVIN
ncbi:pentapeptide repeat-containing protein [Oligoflexaceae bacterium]|nr:pentapeptide repeat-containing protein [Oligoflexaceae bacterium]